MIGYYLCAVDGTCKMISDGDRIRLVIRINFQSIHKVTINLTKVDNEILITFYQNFTENFKK